MALKKTMLSATAAIGLLSGAQAALAADEITVAYFLEWPMPFQYAKAMGTYEEALGVPVNWVSFDTGTAMFAAMASGDVDISVSLGAPPFAIAVSAGQDIEVLDVAVSYSENDNCVVASALEIDKTNAKELEGKKVGIPIGTAAHFGFLEQMNHFGVDIGTMEIVDMAPPDGAAAFAQGNMDMVCGWGGALRRMKEYGNVLLTGPEKEEIGIFVFDVTAARSDFVDDNFDLVAKFLSITAEMNSKWNAGEDKSEMVEVIAKDAGMDEVGAEETLATFVFPSVEEQLSEKWLGGGSQEFMKKIAEVFVEAGSIKSSLDSYSSAINVAPLTAASGM